MGVKSPIRISSSSGELIIRLLWLQEDMEDDRRILKPVQEELFGVPESIPALVAKRGTIDRIIRLDRGLRPFRWVADSKPDDVNRCSYIGASGIRSQELAKMWDQIALTDLEPGVVQSLRIVHPGIERLTFVDAGLRREERSPRVRISGNNRPIPLRSLGDGVFRLFAIALALANADGGILLVDEIENGIHYSIQQDVWKLIVDGARRLNVQLFATTHSWDCVKAFQAATRMSSESGVLIRLESSRGKIRAIEFDEDELEIATEQQIEVR
jgi:hypothetical protein